MEKANTGTKSDVIKVISGLLIFLAVGILLTSKKINLPENAALLILQSFILGLILMAISSRGYYFSNQSRETELPQKLLLFSIVLIPTALIFLVNQSYQIVFFFISFFLSISFILIHDITSKKEDEKYFLTILTFLTSVWSLFGVIVLLKTYKFLPDKFFKELSFLQLDVIRKIEIVLRFGIGIYISIIAFIEVKKSENEILGKYPIPPIPFLKKEEIEIYHSLLKPILWVSFSIVSLINALLFAINTVLKIVRITLDLILRFVLQVLRRVINLVQNGRSIIFFLLLYFACFSLPFIIKANSIGLLNYIRGDNSNFQFLAFQLGLIVLVIFVFRLLINVQFCNLKNGENVEAFPRIVSAVYIDNFIPLIYCILSYCFFIALNSVVFWLLSNHWNYLQVQGYSSIGKLSQWCFYILGAMALVVIPLVLLKSKIATKTVEPEKKYFVFTRLKWSAFWKKAWVLIFVPLIFFASYVYAHGAPYNWFNDNSDDSEITNDTIDIDFYDIALAEKIKRDNERIKNDSIVKAEELTELQQKQEKIMQDSIRLAEALRNKREKEKREMDSIIAEKRIAEKKKRPIPPVTSPYITQSPDKNKATKNSIYIINNGNIPVEFQLSVDNNSYQDCSLKSDYYSYFTFYKYTDQYYAQWEGFIRICTATNNNCVHYRILAGERYAIEWDEKNKRWDVKSL